jgi:hypothetical protein
VKTLLRVTFNLLALLGSSLLLSQCDRHEISSPQTKKVPFVVSAKEALEVAQRYIAAQDRQSGKPGARANSSVAIVGEETILDDMDKEPLFHVMNRAKGFIIVSADLRTMPVLAYSDESQFDTKKMPFGVKDWFETAKSKIKDAKKSGARTDSVVIKEWRKYLSGTLNLPNSGARTAVNRNCEEWYRVGQYMCQGTFTTRGPLLNTSWGQEAISTTSLTWDYKNCDGCGRFLAGCGPVAMAQIYEYHRPDPSRPRSSNYSCSASDAGEYSLGQLMLSCGNASRANYDYFGSCNTFTWPSDVKDGFGALGFSSGGNQSAGFNYQTVKNEILNNKPLIFWGSTCLSCFSNYHIWVADGLQENNYSEYDCDTGQCSQWSYSYIHMNWGWNGGWNGWYAFGQYNPSGQNYNANLHIISGIRS